MNKSIKYIKDRIKKTPDTVMGMPVDGWDDCLIINPIEKLTQIIPKLSSLIENNQLEYMLGTISGKVGLSIKYNPLISDFDYFAMGTTTHDGTFIFTDEAVRKLLLKVLYLQTVAINKTHDDFINSPHEYKVEYILGDLLVHSDFGLKTINSREVYGETDIVVLPIKFDINKIHL